MKEGIEIDPFFCQRLKKPPFQLQIFPKGLCKFILPFVQFMQAFCFQQLASGARLGLLPITAQRLDIKETHIVSRESDRYYSAASPCSYHLISSIIFLIIAPFSTIFDPCISKKDLKVIPHDDIMAVKKRGDSLKMADKMAHHFAPEGKIPGFKWGVPTRKIDRWTNERRKRRDSNPRSLAGLLFSRQTHSATLPLFPSYFN